MKLALFILGFVSAESYDSSSESSSYEFDYNYEYINETMYEAYLNWLYQNNYTDFPTEGENTESQLWGAKETNYEYAYQYGENIQALASAPTAKTKSTSRAKSANYDYSYGEYNFDGYDYTNGKKRANRKLSKRHYKENTFEPPKDVIKLENLKTLPKPKTTKPTTRRTTQSTRVKTTRRTSRAPYFDETDTKYPKCFICSASAESSNRTIEECAEKGRWTTCKFGEYCGLEVREKSRGKNKFNRFLPKEIYQMTVRCMTRPTCLAHYGNNFSSSVAFLQQCGTNPKESTCFACLKPCSHISNPDCFLPSRGVPTSVSGEYRTIKSLTYESWKSGLRNLTKNE
ncbi:Oidioi.mRNA.OKI2018_I69.chr2.g5329.t1.cds [Oikopleura dioica]|uniref:Oidioi.mRNA.OKI2018_I69.chr2.g5329.t1.cds n=1 Tax=Oikopleura dioica TaxID=34765 RepID=A0ABN7T4C2_OIKDI|nr:Oidioi.mRNA.OKI2018_I69.chr2.g5329.t1.cds [Oikopleura dioica]